MADNNLMADYTFSAKYAKYNPAIRRRETYAEAVDRYIDMHRAKFPQVETSTFDWLSRLMKEKVIVGSQRGMQFGGTAIEEKHARQYNCSAIHITTVEQFRNSLWLLLCGTGVGFSVQKHHIAKLPPLSAPKGEFYHAVEDSIEGWANAAHHLMTAYFVEDAHRPNFDFSGVRPKGAALRHGGKAPGPEPLKLALENCRKILDNAVSQGSRPIKPIEAFDLIMHLSDAVISGGIRRSATLCLFSIDDEEMITAKTGDWFIENAQRGRANISAMITPDIPEAEFRKLFASTKSFGEPGFIFAKSKEVILNPCAEVSMIPTLIKDPKGEVVEHYSLDLVDDSRRQEWEVMGYTFESGVQMCNLTEVNVAKCETPAQFMDACKAAAILGTMQAAYTEFPFLGSVSEQIVEREALLGVSMTGIMSNTVCDDPSTLEHAAELVKETNKEFAKLLGIKQASRTTLVKPSGTASIVLGSSSGIHPWHAPRFIRRVQADALEPLYQFVETHQPERCLKSVWGGEHARVIEFACEAPQGATVREDLRAVEHLEYVKYVNTHWVRTGTAVPRIEDVHHNVSCTITVQDGEWQAVEDYLWENQSYFTGVSLLGGSGDYVYQQAPLQEVGPLYKGKDNEEQRKEMWSRWNKLKELGPLDFSLCVEDEDNTEIAQTVACAGGQCETSFSIPK